MPRNHAPQKAGGGGDVAHAVRRKGCVDGGVDLRWVRAGGITRTAVQRSHYEEHGGDSAPWGERW